MSDKERAAALFVRLQETCGGESLQVIMNALAMMFAACARTGHYTQSEFEDAMEVMECAVEQHFNTMIMRQ